MIPTIDLATKEFWMTMLLAVVLLTPLTKATARQYVFAAVNIMFISLILHVQVLWVLAGVLCIWSGLRILAQPKPWRLVLMFVGLLIALVLFVFNKRPDVSIALGVGGVNPILAAVGYSYAMLRIFDVGRVVYQGGRPSPNPVATINYILPFHMLAAGPIQSYEDFYDQPSVPDPLTPVQALEGIERIALGLFKKFVVAFTIQHVFLTDFYVTGPYMLFEVQMHYIWLFLDFSAYSDIAVGIGKLMGIHTPENFDKPYIARNMIDFWDRWHISLSLWIRRNMFIPMQLNMARKTGGKHPLLIATFAFTVAFLLCGLWHNVSWPFFFWGAMHAVGLVITNTYRYWLTKKLGSKGVKAYRQKWTYRLVAQFLTFEYVAFSLLIIGYPWKELF